MKSTTIAIIAAATVTIAAVAYAAATGKLESKPAYEEIATMPEAQQVMALGGNLTCGNMSGVEDYIGYGNAVYAATIALDECQTTKDTDQCKLSKRLDKQILATAACFRTAAKKDLEVGIEDPMQIIIASEGLDTYLAFRRGVRPDWLSE